MGGGWGEEGENPKRMNARTRMEMRTIMIVNNNSSRQCIVVVVVVVVAAAHVDTQIAYFVCLFHLPDSIHEHAQSDYNLLRWRMSVVSSGVGSKW